ncbi:hypothetical protein KM043_017580 [Ampulex compressa]|nr:hypothetical protein KM043_017580 [Ampulex compressa]
MDGEDGNLEVREKQKRRKNVAMKGVVVKHGTIREAVEKVLQEIEAKVKVVEQEVMQKKRKGRKGRAGLDREEDEEGATVV